MRVTDAAPRSFRLPPEPALTMKKGGADLPRPVHRELRVGAGESRQMRANVR
jgi:hypothetical protein